MEGTNLNYIERTWAEINLDNMIESARIVREELLLHMELTVLCKEDCKGLCPKCGHDLNEGDCGCDRREIDPRLQKLTQLFQE